MSLRVRRIRNLNLNFVTFPPFHLDIINHCSTEKKKEKRSKILLFFLCCEIGESVGERETQGREQKREREEGEGESDCKHSVGVMLSSCHENWSKWLASLSNQNTKTDTRKTNITLTIKHSSPFVMTHTKHMQTCKQCVTAKACAHQAQNYRS